MILVTGANGFVGRALCAALVSSGQTVVAAMRHALSATGLHFANFQISTVAADTDWQGGLQGCDAVVHLAARVHVMADTATDPLTEFRRVNVEGTLNLARQAVTAGVRRFVFISSIKVNGESTFPPHPGPLPTGAREVFRADDGADPQDPYGISKHEAELGLRWLKRGVPLPLGAIHNKRSLVALDNLVDLIISCIDHPAAAKRISLNLAGWKHC